MRDISFGTARARYNDEPQNSKGRILTNKNPPPGPQTYDPNAIREAVYKMSRHRNVAGVKFGTGKSPSSRAVLSSVSVDVAGAAVAAGAAEKQGT